MYFFNQMNLTDTSAISDGLWSCFKLCHGFRGLDVSCEQKSASHEAGEKKFIILHFLTVEHDLSAEKNLMPVKYGYFSLFFSKKIGFCYITDFFHLG